MRLSKIFWQTYKETPADAEVPSHQLLMRAGFINKTTGGIYSYLPFATKVLQKIKAIIREEHEKIGAQEILMSFVTPAELWKSSGRWDKMGPLMIKLKDRKEADFCLSATNEETITDIFSNSVSSYKQLPVNLFQINTKFRDELRPRFGLLRGREFIMKDGYSFHMDKQCMDEVYDSYFKAYSRILERMGLEFIAVEADGGDMAYPGAKTHEFQVIADTGEDDIVEARDIGYAANVEAAETVRGPLEFSQENELSEVETQGQKTCVDVAKFLDIPIHQTLKTLAYTAGYPKKDGSIKEAHYLFMLLGDDDANTVKLANYLKGASFIQPMSDKQLEELSLPKGYMSPLGVEGVSVVFDKCIDCDASYVVGANKENFHVKGFIPSRELSQFKSADLRESKETDFAPDGKTHVKFRKGIEAGDI